MAASPRPADIISPIKDKATGPKTSPEEARKMGRFVYDRPTAQKPS